MNKQTPYSINVNGKLIDLAKPQVMGILNVTPDSFYSGSRKQTEEDIRNRVKQIINEGGQMIDIGAYSSGCRRCVDARRDGAPEAWHEDCQRDGTRHACQR